MTHEEPKVQDNVRIILRDEFGNIKHDSTHNTMLTAGKNMIADRMLASPTLGVPTHVGIGTGTYAGGTALTTEIDRNAFTTKTRSGAVVTIVTDWAAGDPAGTNAITEAGVFDASSAGNMHCGAFFGAITKAPGDTLQITWTITIS